jgi:uncharacterized protein YcgI (DUF1989 family)
MQQKEDSVAEQIHIPAREGRGVRLSAGTRFRVVDLEGGQVADLFAFGADDITEYASAEHTRVAVDRLFPRVGEHFVTNRRRPILHFEEDATPGVHDMLCAACDPSRYAGLGVEGWHASCQENLQRAMAALGHTQVEIPQPINLFMNIPIVTNGSAQTEVAIGWEAALTKPEDYVTMRAELDCYIVVSACPQDIVAINNRRPTALAIEVLAG